MAELSREELESRIGAILNEVLAEKGLDKVTVGSDTELLGGELGIDSLDLATLVIRLSEDVDKDPFADGFQSFRTVGELASLYHA